MFVSDFSVPLKMRIVEYFMFDRGSKATRKTTPTSGPAGSAFSSVTFSPSTSLAGAASAGEGVYLVIMPSSSLMPTSWRASVKTIGISLPVRSALTNTVAISAAGISSPPRYRSIRASSASTTFSMSWVWASATLMTGESPAAFSMQSMTDFLSAAGRFAQRHWEPKVSWTPLINSGRSTFSAAILLITIMRGLPISPARANSFRVFVSMPEAALTTMIAVSAAGIAAMAGPTKSGDPGASMRLISLPLYCAFTTEARIECLCSFSSS